MRLEDPARNRTSEAEVEFSRLKIEGGEVDMASLNRNPECIPLNINRRSVRSSKELHMARAVGIDLGTTNSAIAVLEGGEPTICLLYTSPSPRD